MWVESHEIPSKIPIFSHEITIFLGEILNKNHQVFLRCPAALRAAPDLARATAPEGGVAPNRPERSRPWDERLPEAWN